MKQQRIITKIVLCAFLGMVLGSCVSERKPVPVGPVVVSDVSFLPEGRTEKMDIYFPDESRDTQRLLIVFIHGGGWMGGDKAKRRERSVCMDLARAGYVVASINYKLAEKSKMERNGYYFAAKQAHPQNLRDCKSAVRFFRVNAKKYGIDADRIAVMGASAGAHLAAMVAYTSPEDGFEPMEDGYGEVASSVKVFVGLYGVYEWKTFSKKHVRGDEELPASEISPITYVQTGEVPTYLAHGRKDKVVKWKQTERLAEVLREKKVEHQAVLVEGAPHSFDLAVKEHDVRGDILAFLKKHL